MIVVDAIPNIPPMKILSVLFHPKSFPSKNTEGLVFESKKKKKKTSRRNEFVSLPKNCSRFQILNKVGQIRENSFRISSFGRVCPPKHSSHILLREQHSDGFPSINATLEETHKNTNQILHGSDIAQLSRTQIVLFCQLQVFLTPMTVLATTRQKQ